MRVDSPRSLTDALALLAEPSDQALLLAGGSDLMVELRTGRTQAKRIVDLWKVDELRGCTPEDGGVRIGALTTCSTLLEDEQVQRGAPLLIEAAHTVGAQQIRNRATIGGNLGTASPAADIIPALIALSARIRLRSLDGERDLDCEDFITGYRQTARLPGELIESIFIPERPPGERQHFRKVGTRKAQAISKLVIALTLSESQGEVTELKAAAGSVAAHATSLPSLQRELVGRALDESTVRAAIQASLASDIAPIDDVRSTADYRRQVFARVLCTMLLG